jgi:hypothetical protein
MDGPMYRTSVVIETTRYSITGQVTLPPHARLSDYANDVAREFFAVTNAHVAPLDQPERGRYAPFALVARHEIAMLYPGDCDMSAESPSRAAIAAQFDAFMEY